MTARVGVALALWTAMVLSSGRVPAEERGPALHFDPFARPDLSARRRSRPDPAARAASGWKPRLLATLVDGDESLANLGGVVLRIGEETHGYRLLEVRTFEALFRKGGAKLVVRLEPGAGKP